MVFFCTNLTAPAGVPAPQPCPQGEGTITGVLTEADIVGPGAQGICPPLPTTPPCVSQTSETRFSQLIEALRAEAAYGNVHTMAFPGGEVRGQIHFDDRRFDGRGHDDKGHNGLGN
jgi:CHRD domain